MFYLTLNCNKCGKDLKGKGVWAAHNKIPKLDFPFCGRCWYYDKNPDISYNGNIQDPRDKSYKHYKSRFHDENDEPFIIPSTPVIYKVSDTEEILLTTPEDKLEFFGRVVEGIGLALKEEKDIN